MDGQRSREALGVFLDYLADKGLMERNTAQSRKAAASRILSVLEEPDAADVTTIDVDEVVARFGRLYGKEYTPKSLTTYRSRLQSALDDFKSYLNNPLAFRPGIKPRMRRSKIAKDDAPDPAAVDRPRPEIPRSAPLSIPPAGDNILPIPIRADLTVRIQGLPFDLTPAEAQKIAAVITAMAQTQPPSTRG